MTLPLVEIRDLVVCYGDNLVAEMPELTLEPGQCVALVGESGSGKTTVLQATLGLLRDTDARVTGSVLVHGVNTLTAAERELQQLRGGRIALVMQNPQGSLDPTMRLGRFMTITLARHGIIKEEAKRRTADAFEAVGLAPSIARRYPHQVSGGQAQRFGIAVAVALQAEVIAADEPTSALDVTVQAEVIALLQRLQRQRDMALLLVSHDLALVSTVADRVVVMHRGAVLESGDTAEILRDPETAYTRELIAAVPDIGSERANR